MQIKEQIRARREQLGVSVSELARRVGVSAQSVRHWESGRSFPGKSKAPHVESALSFTLDWTEGKRTSAAQPQMAALVAQGDIDLLLLLCRLPTPFKDLMTDMARMHLAAIVGDKKGFSGKASEQPAPPFNEKEEGQKHGTREQSAGKRPAPRKKAAR